MTKTEGNKKIINRDKLNIILDCLHKIFSGYSLFQQNNPSDDEGCSCNNWKYKEINLCNVIKRLSIIVLLLFQIVMGLVDLWFGFKQTLYYYSFTLLLVQAAILKTLVYQCCRSDTNWQSISNNQCGNTCRNPYL